MTAVHPKLFNWVRAIRNISLISAIYSSVVIVISALIFFCYQAPADLHGFPYQILASLAASIVFTIAVREFLSRKLKRKFKSDFSFELLLANWCVMLILIHLQCQLLCLMLFRLAISPLYASLVFLFASSVIFALWPRLSSIQSLLKDTK